MNIGTFLMFTSVHRYTIGYDNFALVCENEAGTVKRRVDVGFNFGIGCDD